MFSDLDIAKGYLNKAQSAKDRDLDFELSFSFYKRCLNKKRCYYTNKLMDRSSKELAPTLERLDPKIGYTESNTVVVCKLANSIKSVWEHSDISINDIERMIKKLKKR